VPGKHFSNIMKATLSKLAQAVACIREMPGSNLGQGTEYPEEY
jgi:hypothetical protein